MTPRSLVGRLTAMMAAIIVVSFSAWAVIVHRSTAATYRQVQQDVRLAQGPAPEFPADLVSTLDGAWAEGGWSAVRSVVASVAARNEAPPFLLVDREGGVAAATRAEWEGARSRPSSDGTLTIVADVQRGAARGRRELTTTAAVTLGHGEGVWATLVRLPADAGAAGDEGAMFVARFWHSAAIWLAAVVLVAVAATAWVLRRSVLPIDRLTRAARVLQSGVVPPQVEREGTAEFRDLIDAFNAATASVARADRQRRNLISDIAHELRTPLTNIRGQLEAVEQGLVGADREFLGTIQDETRLLERLVRDVQELALADAGQLSLELQDVPLREAIEACVGPLATQANARLTVTGPHGVSVRADEERLRQVLNNLTENAVRHRPDGLEIVVEVFAGDEGGGFVFRDNGPGVAAEDQAFIFDRFYRGEKSRSRRTGGAGLGLAIVRGLLEAMGGRISYDASGRGASFVVRLKRGRVDFS